MKATTVKVEGPLLAQIEKLKRVDQSVSSFVREVLQKELDRRYLRKAAQDYNVFLAENPDEADWMVAWDQADLVTPPASPESKS